MPRAERAYSIMKEKNKIEIKDPGGKEICYCNFTSAFQHFINDSNVLERLSLMSNYLRTPFNQNEMPFFISIYYEIFQFH